jgi:hypothetical protein
MRVQYVPLTEKQWILYFQNGGGFNGIPYQRGAGLGSLFRSLFRTILPIAQSAGKAVGRRAIKAGAELASDLVAGESVEHAFKARSKQAVGDLLESAAKKMRGGRKRRSTQRKTPSKSRTIKGKKPPLKRINRRRNRTTQLGVLRG